MIDSNNAYTILRNHIEVFCKLRGADWELLLPHLEIKNIHKNELFIVEGKRAFEVAFVMEGMFRQYYTKDGEEKTTYFFFENHLMTSCGCS